LFNNGLFHILCSGSSTGHHQRFLSRVRSQSLGFQLFIADWRVFVDSSCSGCHSCAALSVRSPLPAAAVLRAPRPRVRFLFYWLWLFAFNQFFSNLNDLFCKGFALFLGMRRLRFSCLLRFFSLPDLFAQSPAGKKATFLLICHLRLHSSRFIHGAAHTGATGLKN
jgi:hypothetical protein